MSMESIQGSAVAPILPQILPTSTPERDVNGGGSEGAAPAGPGIPEQLRPPHESGAAAPRVELPPPGVDAELWSVLTSEEREFFSVSAEMGPVTYGREQAARHETSLPRGRRLDVRV